MDDFLQMRLFDLLTKPSQESTNTEMGNAYGCFVKHMKTVSQSQTDHSEIYRMLNNTRIELVFLQTIYRYEQEKKYPEICLPSKSNPIS